MACNSRVAKATSLSQPGLHVKEKEKKKRQGGAERERDNSN